MHGLDLPLNLSHSVWLQLGEAQKELSHIARCVQQQSLRKKQITPLAPCSEPAESDSLAQAPGVKKKQMSRPVFPLAPFLPRTVSTAGSELPQLRDAHSQVDPHISTILKVKVVVNKSFINLVHVELSES